MSRLPDFSLEAFFRLSRLLLIAALILPVILFQAKALHVFTVSQQFTLLCLAPLALLSFFFYRKLKLTQLKTLFKRGPFLFLVFFLIWAAAAGGFSFRKDIAFQWVLTLGASVCAFLCAYLLAADKKILKALITAIFAACIFLSAFALIQLLGLDSLGWTQHFDGRPGSFLGNPNFLAGHLVLTLPLFLAAALSNRKMSVFEKSLRWLGSALVLTLLAATQTRGAWLAALASLVLFAILSRRCMPGLLTRNRKALALTFILLAGSFSVYLATHPAALKRITHMAQGPQSSAAQRLILMKNSLSLANAHPLFGVGPGQLRLYYPLVQAADLKQEQLRLRPYVQSAHSHNDLVQLAAEIGIPGSMLWLAFWCVLFYTAWHSKILKASSHVERTQSSNSNRLLATALFCGLSAMQVHALFNFPMLIAPTLVTAMVMAAILWRLSSSDPLQDPDPSTPSLVKISLLLTFALTMSWLCAQRGNILFSDQLWWHAQGEFDQNKPQAADNYAKAALRQLPQEDRLWALQGKIKKELRQSAQAAQAWETVLALNPNDALTRLELANLRMAQGEYAKVTELLQPLSIYAKNLSSWWSLYGAALFNTGQWQQSAFAYDQAVFFGEDVASALVNQASSLGNLKRYQKALQKLNRALLIKPAYKAAMLGKAVTLYKMGSTQAAIDQLKQILALDPDNREANNYLKIMGDQK